MYHGLHDSEVDAGCFDPVYSVAPSVFAGQLAWLVANGYRTVRLDECGISTDRRIVLSFDDGDISNLAVALPLLREHGMVAEFFVTSDFVGRPGMLSAGDVRALADAGMGVQSHGRTHRFLEDLEDDALRGELVESKLRLEALSGREVTALAFPGGRGGQREHDAAVRAGYRHVLGSEPGVNRNKCHSERYQRIAVKRDMTMEAFGCMVAWRGLPPRVAQWRHEALAWPKRLLGNERYQRLRARLLAR
jgi:peptidoglycan/xylan/chitin deacetylase (PgdA/CDA1 family)